MTRPPRRKEDLLGDIWRLIRDEAAAIGEDSTVVLLVDAPKGLRLARDERCREVVVGQLRHGPNRT